jgi:hypothetical protein
VAPTGVGSVALRLSRDRHDGIEPIAKGDAPVVRPTTGSRDFRRTVIAKSSEPTAREVVVKTLVTHTVTYFVAGFTAFSLFDYPRLIAETQLGASMRPLNHPLVLTGPLLQPVRGVLFGFVFYMLRGPFFGSKQGWLTMWVVLVSVGILGTFGAPPGSLEGVIYTVLPLRLHLTLLPEILVQSLLLSWLLFQWVNHREKRWLNWTMGAAFVLVLILPALALVAIGRG